MRRRHVGAALVALLAFVGACGDDEDPVADITLDGSTRPPDREGIVEEVSLEDIRIDGQRYELSKKLLAFSTYTLTAIPVLATEGSYVHLGVEDGKAVWVAQIAQPLRSASGSTFVYEGTIRRVRGDRVEFGDGTVLRATVEIPPVGSRIQVTIDPDADRIVGLVDG